jgi:hypothetical protein
MALTTLGRDYIAAAIIGDDTGTADQALTTYNNARAALGVGNSTTAFSAAHTDLQGASKLRKAMDATFPTRATNVLTFKSTFGTTDANFAWEEIGVFNSATAATGTMLCRVVQNHGTKASGDTWVLTHAVTVAAA